MSLLLDRAGVKCGKWALSFLQSEGDPDFFLVCLSCPCLKAVPTELGRSLLPGGVSGQQGQAVGKVLLVPRPGAVTSDIACGPSSHT